MYGQICTRNGLQLKRPLWVSTCHWPRAAVELLHAVDLSEEHRLAALQAVRPVVHAGHHPWAALRGTNGAMRRRQCKMLMYTMPLKLLHAAALQLAPPFNSMFIDGDFHNVTNKSSSCELDIFYK